MNFVTDVIKIGQDLRTLWTIEYFNTGDMGAHKSLRIYFKSYSSYKFGLLWRKLLPVTINKHMLNSVAKYS